MINSNNNLKLIGIIKSLCINKKDSNYYYKLKLNSFISKLQFKKNKSDNNNKIIELIKNKKYNILYHYYIKNYSSLFYFISDLSEMINNNNIIISSKNKKIFNELLISSKNINNGMCSLEYIKFILNKNIKNYDFKNFINHINTINKLDKNIKLIDNIKKENKNYYFLRKNKDSFNIIFNILNYSNNLETLQNSYYLNNCGFKCDNEMPEALTKNSLSSKDKFESNNFIQFKISERYEDDINDSITFKKFFFTKSNKNINSNKEINNNNINKIIEKIIKKNKLSSYATTLLLEHIFYVSECLQNNINIDEKYLEKCLISLYNGDAKNINEELVK